MIWPILGLIPVAALIAAVVTAIALRAGRRAVDTAPRDGQFKEAARGIPNTGGIGIFAGLWLPLIAALAAFWHGADLLPDDLRVHAEGVRTKTGPAVLMLACLALVHVLGLIDDRRPLGPLLKLVVMVVPPVLVVTGAGVVEGTRLLELADAHVGGAWLSVLVTVLWFVAVTNAMNFIDNMDGLSAGVAAICAAAFLGAALLSQQWFVASALALLVGACLGYLPFNFPGARIFMGDGGSLVLGFALAYLTVRTTYIGESPTGEPLAGGWYGVLMPLVVLAVPLYDMVSVTLIRLRQGRSPMVGDLQHLSHRLVKRGFGKTTAVLVIWGLTGATALAGVALPRLEAWQATLAGVQTLLLLGVIALLEYSSSPAGARPDSLSLHPR